MQLQRVYAYRQAQTVAQGVRRFNGVAISPRRVLQRPHFIIRTMGRIAGWLGYERRRPRVYELVHLSVRPRYRRRGLAERAVRRTLGKVRAAGGSYIYARVRRHNRPGMRLLSKCGFRRIRCRRVCNLGRSL